MVKVCSVILIRFCMIYAYSRPSQVSIYRTIGPLVSLYCSKHMQHDNKNSLHNHLHIQRHEGLTRSYEERNYWYV